MPYFSYFLDLRSWLWLSSPHIYKIICKRGKKMDFSREDFLDKFKGKTLLGMEKDIENILIEAFADAADGAAKSIGGETQAQYLAALGILGQTLITLKQFK